jgi:glycosyltransferase involved in cell wall biosynthesis
MPDLSIVVSVYNEEESLQGFHEELSRVLESSGILAEILYVNDGSRDRSEAIINELASQDSRVRPLSFTRNFGHEAAMIAGIDHAKSDAVVCLDADLQHPPKLIPAMYEKYREGYDVVNMARKSSGRGFSVKGMLSSWFYKLMNRLSPVELIENASDFFLLSGDVLRSLQTDYRERNRFVRGLIQFLGTRKYTLYFEPVDRELGQSKYSFRKLISLSFIALSSFSKIPLQIGLFIGVLFGLFSIVLGIYSLVMYFLGETPPGYTTLILFISIAFSLQFIMIGIIGLYVGYTFDETKQRPIYIVKSKV